MLGTSAQRSRDKPVVFSTQPSFFICCSFGHVVLPPCGQPNVCLRGICVCWRRHTSEAAKRRHTILLPHGCRSRSLTCACPCAAVFGGLTRSRQRTERRKWIRYVQLPQRSSLRCCCCHWRVPLVAKLRCCIPCTRLVLCAQSWSRQLRAPWCHRSQRIR
jgi:hypothetical protein